MARRRAGTLLAIEVDILTAGLDLRSGGQDEFHGFELARHLADGGHARRLTAHGTLYKALARLESWGLLASRWEDERVATAEGRPRRRLYTVTGAGERRLSAWRLEHGTATAPALQPRLQASP